MTPTCPIQHKGPRDGGMSCSNTATCLCRKGGVVHEAGEPLTHSAVIARGARGPGSVEGPDRLQRRSNCLHRANWLQSAKQSGTGRLGQA